jgi:hypothetical protein
MIKEEPVQIEFTYEPDIQLTNTIDPIKIIYFKENNVPFISFNEIKYPLDFFIEVVDFLTKKGVVKKENILVESHKSSLPLPSITKSGNVVRDSNYVITEKITNKDRIETNKNASQPFPSFNIGIDEEKKMKEIEEEGRKIKEFKNSQNKTPIIKRPVIRTRVTDEEGDPLEAERAAAQLRGSNEEKSIKRID